MFNEYHREALGSAKGMETTTRPGALVLLTRLSRVVHRRSTEELLGMRVKQFGTLCYIRDRGPVLQQDLGESLYMDPNNLVLLLNDLEAHRWVERRRDPDDRRRHIVGVTTEGTRAIGRPVGSMESQDDVVLAGLEEKDPEVRRRLLSKALEHPAAATTP